MFDIIPSRCISHSPTIPLISREDKERFQRARSKKIALEFVEEILDLWHPEEIIEKSLDGSALLYVDKVKDFLNKTIFRFQLEVSTYGNVINIEDSSECGDYVNRRTCFDDLFIGWYANDVNEKIMLIRDFVKNNIRLYMKCIIENMLYSMRNLESSENDLVIEDLNKEFLKGSKLALQYTGYTLSVSVNGIEKLRYRYIKD